MVQLHATVGKTVDERAEDAMKEAIERVASLILSGRLDHEDYRFQSGFLNGMQQAVAAIYEARKHRGD